MNAHRLSRVVALAAAIFAAGCAQPPESAFRTEATSRIAAAEPVGTDARGEACFAQRAAIPALDLPVVAARDVFCGGWTQPAARIVQLRGGTDAAQLDMLAAGGLWRGSIEQRVTCGTAQATLLPGGQAARLLACTRRQGGWPHLALVVAGAEGPVVADGLPTVAPILESLALGTAATQGGAQPRSAILEIAARRLAAESFGADDIGRFERLMAAGRELNQLENFAAAEDAYRAALALQQRVLGSDDPNTASALMHLALNLSNQGRAREAELLFARAAGFAALAADAASMPRLRHYRGLAALNAGDPAAAAMELRDAERGYRALVPDSVLRGGDLIVQADPVMQSAVLGLAETRRNLAIALARGGDLAGGRALVAESRDIMRRSGLEPGVLVARSLRTEASVATAAGNLEMAARQLETAAQRFAVAAPGERPEATTLFLAGARRAESGRRAAALAAFRAGADILRARQIALPVGLVLPYLDALEAEARADARAADVLRAEMFGAAQLAQRSDTVRFVQQASARIGVAGGDARVAAAVRRLQDADAALRALFAERDADAGADLDARIVDAQRTRAEAESEVAAAAPGYRQLLLTATTAADAAAVLAPDEILVTMLFGRDHGLVMALREGRVSAARVPLGEAAVARLVISLRAGVTTAAGEPGRFDPVPARALYEALLAPLAAALDGAKTLIVAPDGPLLAVPFGLLLTGPAEPDALAGAPWLIRRHAIAHIPSPQTFVTLRRAGTSSRAPGAYTGFGDFVPPSAAQLARSFPADRCAADALMAAGLGRLPGTRAEITEAAALLGAGPADVRFGSAFTAAALRGAPLLQRRIIHLATHALLPDELSCLPEPSIVVSPPAGARDADAAFVKASDLLGLQLDADLVILSACNTAGPGGGGGGEALSGLARAFFFAGARGLMATHWAAQDLAAALTVADTLRRQTDGAASAAALRGAQLLLLDEAGRALPAMFAHPFYWAPFALIGDGRGAAARVAAAGGGG